MTCKRILSSLVLLLLCISAAYSQDGVKEVDKAPVLSVDEWLKGDAVTGYDKSKVYLVEFWGTWCGPCIANIPKLTRLQNQYESSGLVVIGVATHELNGREALIKFMDKHGDEMQYRVAYDSDYSMENDWDTGVKSSPNFRMPLCFLINRAGVVVFVGHPGDEKLEGLIEQTVKE